MAIKTNNGSSTDWENAAAWGGVAPADGDGLILPKVGTDITIDTNMDQSDQNYLFVVTQRGCNITIGQNGNPLKCGADRITHEGAKPWYLKAERDAGADEIDLVEVNSDNQTLAMQIDDDGVVGIRHLRVLKGKVETTTGITALPYVEIGRRDNPGGDANLLIDTHATNVVTRLIQNAGTCTIKREVTDLFVGGGICVIDGIEVVTALSMLGGTVQYDSTGALALAMIGGGVLDFTKTWKSKIVDVLRAFRPGRVLVHEGVAIAIDSSQKGTVTFDTAGSPGGAV